MMSVRALMSAVVGAAVLMTATGALAATTDETAPATGDKAPAIFAGYTVSDRIVDPMSEAIRTILSDAGTRGAFLDKRDAAAVAEYYDEQGYAPAWTANGKLTERALAVIARLKKADTDGLNPADYPTPHVQIGLAMPAKIEAVARADVLLSRSIVTYARHAHAGRYQPSDFSRNIDYKPHLPDPVAVLAKVASADDPAAALASYNPTHPEFVALRKKLAEIRASHVEPPPRVPPGPLLRLGSKSPRVAILRERLKITEPADDPQRFDEVVDEAVRAYQEHAGLVTDGIVGPGTLGSLNAAADDHIATILVNMERWRWMPEHLGKFYVRVNIPNFNLDVYKDGKVIHTTRIIDGKPTNQTPIFSDEIEYVIVNPVWNVPSSIAVKEMLPEILVNPIAALRGYNVYANIGGRFRQVNPYMINWSTVDMRRIQIKQPPGEKNALGVVKFMFPNPFAVYLHDTPTKSLFKKDYRAYSHGCMRVMNPWDFASVLLSHEPNVTAASLKKLVGGRERRVNLENHIPVHMTYFTAWVDDQGTLQVRDDVYGLDERMEKVMGGQS
jgi:murein L,D-transpeptidase YcbB/YkuD